MRVFVGHDWAEAHHDVLVEDGDGRRLGGGIVTGFTSATNADKASITPTAAGSFTVQIVITDSGNATSTVTRTVSVAAAPVVSPPTTPPATSGGGGGAASMWWVLGVLSAALALLNLSRRAARRSD